MGLQVSGRQESLCIEHSNHKVWKCNVCKVTSLGFVFCFLFFNRLNPSDYVPEGMLKINCIQGESDSRAIRGDPRQLVQGLWGMLRSHLASAAVGSKLTFMLCKGQHLEHIT